MGTAKPVALSVRPCHVAHLSFEVSGIVEALPAALGSQVKAFDFPAFFAILAGVPTAPGDQSLLLYDSLQIDGVAAPFALVALRKEERRIALAKAIKARQNAYYAKYGHISDIVTHATNAYSAAVLGSKTQRLEVLAGIAATQWNLLKNAYVSENPPRTGVVKTTSSLLLSATESGEYARTGGANVETGGTTTKGQNFAETLSADYVDTTTPGPMGNQGEPTPGAGEIPSTIGFNQLASGAPPGSEFGNFGGGVPQTWAPIDMSQTAGSTLDATTVNEVTKIREQTDTTGIAFQQQTIINTDYGYRTPYWEGAAQYERAQISLIDQQFTQYIATLNLPNLGTVLQNERDMIDGDVYRLQLAYLSTILLSPIAGTVTGVYKRPGDLVRAGEPVIRVEDSSTIYIVATVVYRGPIAIAAPGAPPPVNSNVTVQTKLFDQAPLPAPLPGTVVAARGHRDDDMWDLVIQCSNLDTSGNPIFPLGYHFDFDDTTITIS